MPIESAIRTTNNPSSSTIVIHISVIARLSLRSWPRNENCKSTKQRISHLGRVPLKIPTGQDRGRPARDGLAGRLAPDHLPALPLGGLGLGPGHGWFGFEGRIGLAWPRGKVCFGFGSLPLVSFEEMSSLVLSAPMTFRGDVISTSSRRPSTERLPTRYNAKHERAELTTGS